MTPAMWVVSLICVVLIFLLIYRIYTDWLDEQDEWMERLKDEHLKGPWK